MASARWAVNASGSVIASSAARSVQARWAIWCAMVQPAAGRRPGPFGRRAGRPPARPASADSAVRSASIVSERPQWTPPSDSWCDELALPGGEQRIPAHGVVGEQVGHPEPAEEVERGLHGLAYARARLSSAPSSVTASRCSVPAERAPPAAPGPRAAPGRCGRRPTAPARPTNSGPVKAPASRSTTRSTRFGGGSAGSVARLRARSRRRDVGSGARRPRAPARPWSGSGAAGRRGTRRPVRRRGWSSCRPSRTRPGTPRSRRAAGAGSAGCGPAAAGRRALTTRTASPQRNKQSSLLVFCGHPQALEVTFGHI